MSNYVRWSMQSLEPEKLNEEEKLEQQRRMEELEKAAAEGRQKGYTEGKQQGYSDGYSSGYEQGMAEGMAEGRRIGETAATQLLELLGSFQREREQADDLIAADLQELALDLTRALLKTALVVQPELLLSLIKGLVRDIYSTGICQLHLHPDDLSLVKEHLADEMEQGSWKLNPDSSIERGGCLLETPDMQIDASLPTRWRRLALALGANTDWLTEDRRVHD